MNTIKIITITLFFIATISINAEGQTTYPKPPCDTNYVGISTQHSPILSSPYYTTDMPLDVIIGYIIIDSLTKVKTPDEMEEFLSTLKYSNDTLRRIMKHLYAVVDYDPIRFRRYVASISKTPPITIYRTISDIISQAVAVSPNQAIDEALLSSDVIAHVTVKKVEDSATHYIRVLESEIIESVKGKAIPNCINPPVTFSVSKLTESENQFPFVGSCLQFQFPKLWLQVKSQANDILDTVPFSIVNQSFKIAPNKDYIVFLELGFVCSDLMHSYLDLNICRRYGWRRDGGQQIRPMLALPIENGIVNESGTELNIGNNLTPTEYIAKIRARRDQILNLTNTNQKDKELLKTITKPELSYKQPTK